MTTHARRPAIVIAAVCILVGPAAALAQPLAGVDATSATLGDVCQVIGGGVTLGFGLWHFAVPELYRWRSYVPDAPPSLVDAVAATNFFLSLSLSVVGAADIAMPLLADTATPAGRVWLWLNVGLWTTRAVYQVVKPQGTFSPALQWGMTGAFALTDLLFIIAAVEASL